jgi:uncharacterized protein
MATMYKTPGVYVEEIPKFPPSIAAVETAIPAFIGYTEKAERNGQSLNLKPTRIESIAEYELYFGGGPPQNLTVYLDTNNQITKTEGRAKFYLYDSLRMFYANGGGNCYIVSVKSYPTTPVRAELENGIKAIKIEDEPTILTFPDAAALTSDDLCTLQQQALDQCNVLKDRVTLCDLTIATNSIDFKTSVQEFRDKIGVNYLKYGAAYSPWIKANLPRTLWLRDIQFLNNSSVKIDLKNLTTDTSIQKIISDVTQSAKVVDDLKSVELTKWEDQFKKAENDFNTSPTYVNATILYGILVNIILEVKKMTDTLPVLQSTDTFRLQEIITNYVSNSNVKIAFEKLVANHLAVLNATTNDTNPIELISSTDLPIAATFLGSNLAGINPINVGYIDEDDSDDDPDPANPIDPLVLAAAETIEEAAEQLVNANLAKNAAVEASSSIISFFRFVQSSASDYEKQFNDALLNAFGTYKSYVNKAIETLNTIPPSGAIAGVYAATDRDRGVWKAPANVSLNTVIEPAVKISHEQQGEFNVDVNAGKSINIIRSFTGKGTLVWGARTLAGNDNEWRYISVRRFFNMVEESTKKATEQFVFEPNDANTWVKVQAMIENFLNTLWRQGALQGVKPEHAYYVSVGLGKTMTPLDILEGRMIIEIGMAAVRPAEFIILKFSHKMAES